jgi:hypothetical protein
MEVADRGRGIAERGMGGGPAPELQLLRRNFCLYDSESKTVLRQRRRPSTHQLNTFSVKRQPYQVVRRTRGTTWHLAE